MKIFNRRKNLPVQEKHIVRSLIFLTLAGGSWWLLQQDVEEPPVRKPQAHTPDYYLENFTIISMDLEGNPKQHLTAQRMEHYPDDDSTELSHPIMILRDGDQPPWEVRSESGWLSGDGEKLQLTGTVTIDRAAGPDNRPMHLATTDMLVRPKENYAESSQKVTIHSLNDRQESGGMQAWFEEPVRLKFGPKVRGYYEIN